MCGNFMISGDPGTSPMSPLYNESESEYCKTCGTFSTDLDTDNNCMKCEIVECTLCHEQVKVSETKRFLCRSVCKECIEYSTEVENVSVRVKVLEQIEKEIDIRKKCINALETLKKEPITSLINTITKTHNTHEHTTNRLA